ATAQCSRCACRAAPHPDLGFDVPATLLARLCRDATAILIAYRHGLRASELCELTWNMIELDSGRSHVRRAKNGVDSTHPLTGKEIRALRQLRRENLQSRYVFNTERGVPVTTAWFLKMVRRTGELANLPFAVHPHMLRHACGFKLA